MAYEMTVTELEERIESCRNRIRSAEAAIAERPDSSRAQTLNISIRPIRAELAELEHRLEEARKKEPEDPREEKIRKELEKNQAELDDIEETDPIKVNNLTVSKRFLQMERNQLLIRLTNGGQAEETEDEEVAGLRKANEAKTRIIEDQNAKIEALRKELASAKAALGNPEDGVSCDETRVTVTAGLTCHCRESEDHVRELEERCRALSGQLETSVRRLREAENEIKGLREYIAGSR